MYETKRSEGCLTQQALHAIERGAGAVGGGGDSRTRVELFLSLSVESGQINN
jgi:hypothetical protein